MGGIILFWYWVFNTKQETLSTFFNIASVFLFIFIIAYLLLYIVVLFLFGCCHFWWRNEVLFQFISIRWVLQDICLILYIHCVPISKNHQMFSSLYCCIFQYINSVVDLLLNHTLCVSYFTQWLVPAQDVHFFYTLSHLSALQNCALLFSTNF